jgi:hypothetical protein
VPSLAGVLTQSAPSLCGGSYDEAAFLLIDQIGLAGSVMGCSTRSRLGVSDGL